MNSPPPAKEGDAAEKEVSEARRKSTSRRELQRNDLFDEVSPEVGELDEEAVERAMDPGLCRIKLRDGAGNIERPPREAPPREAPPSEGPLGAWPSLGAAGPA